MAENAIKAVSDGAQHEEFPLADVPVDDEAADKQSAGHRATIETASWAPASITVSAVLAVALTAPR